MNRITWGLAAWLSQWRACGVAAGARWPRHAGVDGAVPDAGLIRDH